MLFNYSQQKSPFSRNYMALKLCVLGGSNRRFRLSFNTIYDYWVLPDDGRGSGLAATVALAEEEKGKWCSQSYSFPPNNLVPCFTITEDCYVDQVFYPAFAVTPNPLSLPPTGFYVIFLEYTQTYTAGNSYEVCSAGNQRVFMKYDLLYV